MLSQLHPETEGEPFGLWLKKLTLNNNLYIYIYSSPFPVKALDHHLQSTFVLVPHDFSSLE